MPSATENPTNEPATMTTHDFEPADTSDEPADDLGQEELAPTGPSFADLGLTPTLAAHVQSQGYLQPTPIQARAIPILLAGRDLLGQAQTGTGKTAAYGLPLLQRLDPTERRVQALVLVPTRELALQVVAALLLLCPGRDPGIAAVYGGEPIGKQIRQLQMGAAVVVATPGRLLDHLERGTIDFSGLRLCVLDEADEMLDMGFLPDVESILERTPPTRQTALLSATLAGEIAQLAAQHLRNPELITVVSQIKTNENVEQRYVVVQPHVRAEAVARLLDVEVFEAALVFARTKLGCDELTEALQQRGVSCEALHGDLAQPAREAVIRRLRDGRLRVVVATDVAARGLDVPSLDLVVTVELPGQPETYVHRIGRTGRAGRSGKSILVLAPRDERRLRMLERFLSARLTWQAVPTPAEVAEVRRARFAEQVVQLARDPGTAPFLKFVQQIGSAEGAPDAMALAAALCRMAAPTPVVEAVLNPPPPAPPEAPPKVGHISAPEPAPRKVVAKTPAPAAKTPAPATSTPAPAAKAPAAKAPAPVASADTPESWSAPVTTPAAKPAKTKVAAEPALPAAGVATGPADGTASPRKTAAKTEAPAEPRPTRLPAESAFIPAARPESAPAARAERTAPAFYAVSVGVGARNGVTPAMLVAVMSRGLEIPGKNLGRIEIRDNYSLVEVPSAVVAELPTRLHGVLVCGRFLNPRPAREVLEREQQQRRTPK
jgi:ATP-dependent RNA helicase DeaD